MPLPLLQQLFKPSTLSRRFIIIIFIFVALLLGMLTYTITILHKDNSNALRIDLAGRQRMLFQQHLNEVFLTSQRISADYAATRHLIQSGLKTLMEGGTVVVNPDTDQRQTILAVPTQEIFEKLRQQQTQSQHIFNLADRFLEISPDHPEFQSQLQNLSTQHALAIQTADQAVKPLNAYSSEAITTMAKWELLLGIVVGLLGILATSKVVRDGRKLENEVEERKQAEAELRHTEQTYREILDSISDMVFLKDRQFKLVWGNKAFREFYNMTIEELKGIVDSPIHAPEYTKRYHEADGNVLQTGTVFNIPEESIVRHDGEVRLFHTIKTPLLGQNGKAEQLVGVARDITERKQVEDMMIRSRDFSLTLLDKFPAMVWRSGLDGKCDYFNQTWLAFTGRTMEEERGNGWTHGVHPEDREHCLTTYQNAFEAREGFEMEYRLRRYDGTYRWIIDVGHPFNNLEGEFVGFIGSCYDITPRKEGEKSLQEWKTLTDSILGQLPKGFAYRCLNEKKWTIIYASEGIEKVTGVPVSEFLSGAITYDTLMAPGENERVWPIVQEALANRLPYENEHQIIAKDGKKKWILARGRFVFDDSGQLLYLDGLNIDITEHKRIENDLRASEQRFRSLIEHIPFCIHEISLDGKISSMNQAGQKMIGIQHESEIIGCSYLTLTEEHDHDRFRGYFTLAVQGQPVNCEFRVAMNENLHVYTKSFIPILGQDGEVVKILGISEDITERRLAEERLRQSESKLKDALRHSDELKSALLASVSHELRTPLTAIKASVSSLTGNTQAGTPHIEGEFLNTIDQEINYMNRLVDNLLDMSQIEAGTLVPRREWHLLEDLVEGALRHTEQIFSRQNIDIHIPEDLPPIQVDAIGIQQVLINLFDNATKYSTPGSLIQLHVIEKLQQIIIQISNEGEPIQAEDLERIFDRFYRCPLQRNHPIRGTGLGLAICKGIIEAHGGEIWGESIGSRVIITFILPVTESMASFSLEGLQKGQG